MHSAEEIVDRLKARLPGIRHRADTLAGTGTSIAADELRHLAAWMEKILNGDWDDG